VAKSVRAGELPITRVSGEGQNTNHAYGDCHKRKMFDEHAFLMQRTQAIDNMLFGFRLLAWSSGISRLVSYQS
jgi:hypothetical protein